MKKLLFLFGCLRTLSSLAQEEKWFLSFSAGPVLGGPSATIKNQMVKQSFNDNSSYNFFGLRGTYKYPYNYKQPCLLLRFGKQITKGRTLYFVIGQADKAEVLGSRKVVNNFFGLSTLPTSYYQNARVNYQVLQLTAGYMYQTNSNVKIGLGPSLFVVPYSFNDDDYTALTAGVSLTARLPLGKEKRSFGMNLFVDANLAPPIKMKNEFKQEVGFQMDGANMMQISAGLAFTVRNIK